MQESVNILGTEYKIITVPGDDMGDKAGDTDFYTKTIRLSGLENLDFSESTKNVEGFKKSVLRHEVVHAFLFESGMDMASDRGTPRAINEEMVDWFAIQSPKIFKAFTELELL